MVGCAHTQAEDGSLANAMLLMDAAYAGRGEIVKKLLDTKVDIDLHDKTIIGTDLKVWGKYCLELHTCCLDPNLSYAGALIE